MAATLYDEALAAVLAAALVKFSGASGEQCAFEVSPEMLFGDPEKWPTAAVPCVAVFDGPVVAQEPRPRGIAPDLYQEGDAEIVAWLHGATIAALTTAARETKRDLINLIDEVSAANPWSDGGWTLEWETADTKASASNTGFYVAVRVRFTVKLSE